MATLILIVAAGGFLLLTAATITLVVLNWSEKTLAPVLSILLVGTTTILATVLVSLKASTIESAFTTSVVLDTNEGLPPIIIPDASNPRVSARLMEFNRLGRPAVNRDEKTTITIQRPTNEDDRFRFTGELLQYRLLHIIGQLQRGGSKVGQMFGASIAAVKKPIQISTLEDYPGTTFLDVIVSNRFSNSDMERFFWEHIHIPLPRNTKVSLVHVPTSSVGPEKFIVQLKKPLFFDIQFVIQPMGATGLGILPAGLTLQPDVAARCQTYQMQVTMQAEFEKITAGNSQTQEYKDWANWLYSGVKENLED